jgi:MOSC domain-containing protein YiiM
MDLGLCVTPGQMGENIATMGVALLARSVGAVLRPGPRAALRITGLRSPCAQIESFMPGLRAAALARTKEGDHVRKAGVMGVVLESGSVEPVDVVTVVHAPRQHVPLRAVLQAPLRTGPHDV